jgi:pimeloyl-ACP methyl ester carboxylesterase
MVPIAYQTFGRGPDLLLITGQDGTMSWWDPALLSDLSSHYTVTMFDLPGAGYSGPTPSPLSLPWMADMTAGLVLTLGLSDPIVLGWGLGGEIALSLAERHPRIASSLVLVDTSAAGAGASRPTPAVVRLLATPGDTPSELSGLLFPPTTTGLQERAQWQSYLFQGSPDWLTAPSVKAQAALQVSVWKSTKLLEYLPRVKIPVLVVSGADDVVFPSANATELATRLHHASLDILPGAGYDAMAEDEPAFVAAVERFTG